MKRRHTGDYELISTVGERVKAFVPDALPPRPPLAIDRVLRALMEQALLELGRLDGITAMLPDAGLFLYSYVRKEAVLSSQIEGTQSSLSDVLILEMEGAPGAPVEDVRAVLNYVAALEHGLTRLQSGFPLCNRLLCEMHGRLLATGRGAGKTPGVFRTSQNWIGGVRPGAARFVPPPPQRVPACMSALERFLHDQPEHTSPLLKAALAHVQFETIHPFLDGNGRLGRLLITLLLCHDGVLRDPMLYLSLYFKQHRQRYYDLLQRVRQDGDWEAWLAFFMTAVVETGRQAVATVRQLAAVAANDRERMREFGRMAASALRVHEVFLRKPIFSIPALCAATGLVPNTAAKVLRLLCAKQIVGEVTGRRRDRLFSYRRYLAILAEGTEPQG